MDHADLTWEVSGREEVTEWKYLSERALAYTSQEDEMEEIDVAIKVDGLRNEEAEGMDRRDDSLWGDSRQHPLRGKRGDEKTNKQVETDGLGSRETQWRWDRGNWSVCLGCHALVTHL